MAPRKNLSRRQFLTLTGQTAFAGLLASCAPAVAPQPAAPAQPAAAQPAAPTAAAPTAAPIKFDFLSWGGATDDPAYEKLIAEFKKKQPNITINWTPVADPMNNFWPKLQASIAGGSTPAVSTFNNQEWQSFSDKGLLAEIDNFIGPAKLDHLFRTDIKGIDDSTTRKGKRYFIPLMITTMVMFYNRKLFKEAGIPEPTDNWTFEDFMDKATKLTNLKDPANKRYGLEGNGTNYFRDIHWIRSTGKTEFDTIIDPKKSQFNTKEIVDIIQMMTSDIYNKLKISPTAADQQGGVNKIDTGSCAMKYEGPWYLPALNNENLRKQNKAIDVDVVMMPKGKDSKRWHRVMSEGIALMKTKQVNEGWEFIKFCAGEEGNKIYSQVTGRMPNDLKLAANWWVPLAKEQWGITNGMAFINAVADSQVDIVSGVGRSKVNDAVVRPVGWDVITAGKGTAAEVLPKVDAELQKLFDEYWKTQK